MFYINFGGWDYFLFLQGVVAVCFGHLGEILGDEVEDVGCNPVLRFLFRELLQEVEEGLMDGDGEAVDDGVVAGEG